MATLADLMGFRARLEDARYSGVRRVKDSSGEEIEYKSDSELARALAAVESQISQHNRQRASRILPTTSKGL